jgi:hypothetical protein
MIIVVHNTEMSGRSHVAGLAEASGLSYVMVLFTIAVLGSMALSFVTLTGVETDIASNYVNNTRAHYLARAGLNVAIWGVLNIPNFTDDYGNRPTRYTFDGMQLYFMVKRAALNKSVYVGSYGNIEGAVATFEHLIISSLDLQEEPPCMVAYGEGTQTAPRYRTWRATSWSPEAVANAADDEITWVVLRGCPVRDEKMLGTLDAAGHIYVQVWDGSSWGPAGQAATYADSSCRGFDIAYESVSGDGLVVYKRGFHETDVYYRTWDGTSWSAEGMLDLPTSGYPTWVVMASDPNSDEMVVAVHDSQRDIAASVWNGSAFTNTIMIETNTASSGSICVDVGYESVSGRAMVVWGASKADNAYFRIWDGVSWSAQADAPVIGAAPVWLRLASDPTSNRILLGTLDDAKHVNVMFWNGASWEAPFEVEAGVGTTDGRCFDVAYESSGDEAMVAWWDNGVTTLDYRVWTSGVWSAEMTGPELGDQIWIVQLVPSPVTDIIVLSAKIHTAAHEETLTVARWSGSVWGAPATVELDSSDGSTESFMVSF